MALRKAIGSVKDQTSIGIAKVAPKISSDIEVAVVKATSHRHYPASNDHAHKILRHASASPRHVIACVGAVSRRLGRTRDWIVALKSLVLVHRLLSDGGHALEREIMFATRKGTRLLNMSGFIDVGSWDHSAFVRAYALFLDQKMELMAYERKLIDGHRKIEKDQNSGYERVFGRVNHLQRVLDRLLSCRPMGMAKDDRIVIVAMYPVVGESFRLYADLCEVLALLLDQFFEMEYSDCVRALDCYMNGARKIDELIGFYDWCKEIGLARSSEYPHVERISSKILETLDEFVRDREKAPKMNLEEPVQEQTEEPVPDKNEFRALPPPEDNISHPLFKPEPEPEPQQLIRDLMDLSEENVTIDDHENRFALALFAGSTNGSCDPFTTSAWQAPAADPGKEDWESALVESASYLSNQKATLGGGFDSLLLDGIYEQGMVNQQAGATQFRQGSASSVVLPMGSQSGIPVLALPAPDGTIKVVGEDPFVASLAVPPPSYVQMAEMEKKQHLLMEEQLVWQQYEQNGMRGQASLAKLAVTMPYGMPTINNVGLQPAGYYYAAQY